MSRERVLVVVNPAASRAADMAQPALAALSAAGFEVILGEFADAAGMRRVLCDQAHDADAVVVAGGDGSLQAALPALLKIGKPLGILPLGTANDLARTLGIPEDPIAAAQIIARGHSRAIDIGRVNGTPFLNTASIGLSVQVAEHQNSQRKRRWGVLSYAVATLAALRDAERIRAVIECDSARRIVRAYQIAVGNGVYYGGGMMIAPDAAIDDGMLDVYAIETRTIAELVALAPALRAGRHGDSPHVSMFRCRALRIETRRPVPVNADGEVVSATPAEFTMVPRALEILVPR